MKTLIVDGHNSAWRLAKKMPVLTTAKEEPIQVVYGFLRLLRKALVQFDPQAALICWDSGRSVERLKIFPEYKANRNHFRTPAERAEYESVHKQMGILQGLLKLLNISQVSYPNTEGDDLIGIACQALGGKKVILSSDQDMLHLVSEKVEVWSPHKEELYTALNFHHKIGMTPRQWLEYRALVGDHGDNIPGVAKGFGEQTAKDIMALYGSLEKLYCGNAKIEKRICARGNRYSLLYSEGAKERVYRNLLLMDLMLPSARPGTSRIIEVVKKAASKHSAVNRVALREYFVENSFNTLLKVMPKWILPFENLDVK